MAHGADFLVRSTDPVDTVIPDDLGHEERMLVAAIEDWAEREVTPVMDRVEAGDGEVIRRLFQQAADLGIFMAEVPEEMGGLDLDVLAITGMVSSRAEIGGLGSVLFGHQGIGMLPIVSFGTPEQVERYLVPCMEGQMLSAFALTEPGTGSDAMNIKTRAVLNDAGSHYVVDGSKQWITNSGWADIFILFAKVDGEHFTAFIMDGDAEGLTRAAPERLLGQHGSYVGALSLDGVKVPVENVLGDVGQGHKVAFCILNMGRLKLAATSATGAGKALKAAVEYASQRVQFGRPIAEFGLIRRKLTDMAARAYAAQSVAFRTAGLVYKALEATDAAGAPSSETKLAALAEFSAECALAKVYTSEAYNGLADEALQVFGGYGFSEEYAPAHMYRDSRITRIYEGTNEICRLYSQRAILKRWGRGKLDLSAAMDPDLGAPSPGFDGVHRHLAAMKAVYARLAGAVVSALGPDHVGDPENQQMLGSLADIAIEIYATESAYLRVAKVSARPDDGHHDVRRALVAILLDHAATRVRAEARTILAEMFSGKDLTNHVCALEEALPTPTPLVDARATVVTRLVELGGELPEVTG